MCCSGPKWKREVVPDHKFDFVDTREFTDNGFMMRMKYLFVYMVVLKSFLVYISDIFTATTMLSTSTWANEILNTCAEKTSCIVIPFEIGKWLFVGCIIFSFLLLAYESHKAKKIIASRDISYTFTNIMANNYYSIRSYDHFCFFDHIGNSTKTSDDFAFFVFFTFKSWKRVIFADGPRQTINGLTLYAIWLVKKDTGPWYDVSKYFANNSLSTSAITVTTFFTVVVFLGSLLLLFIACLCYVPLLMHIRGNLKEYCCHKVDKRIDAVIKRRQKQRLAENAKNMKKEMEGDFSHLKNKKGELVGPRLPQPTLPSVKLDDEFDDSSSFRTRAPPASTYTQDSNFYYSEKADYIPPMPAYNPYSTHPAPDANYEQSMTNLDDPYYQNYYADNNSQTGHLTSAQQSAYSIDRMGSVPPQQQGYGIDRTGSVPPQHQGYGIDRTGSVPPQHQGYGIERTGSVPPQHQGYATDRTGSVPPQQDYYYDAADVYNGQGGYSTNSGLAPPNQLHRHGSGLAYDDSSSVGTPTNDPYNGYASGYSNNSSQRPGYGQQGGYV